ncbi:MAG: NAD(+)/NADH kinase [Anaerolineae bacterium]|jgi:NAD+ kinase|nr:NAD(+)/NADH kinase [Anaerolineae bacterium]
MNTCTTDIRTIGLIYNARVERSRPLADDIAAWLHAFGVGCWTYTTLEYVEDCPSADLLVTLGGDGSILRVAQRAAPAGIAMLGINLGRVGFLTEAAPEAWQVTLKRVLNGEGAVEARMMLCVSLLRDGAIVAQEQALNDAVISRGALARTVRLYASVDGAFMTRYVADGLILATPTGSTAYAYAVGGPILPPWLENIVLIPAAPHLSLERPFVLNAEAIVEVRVETEMDGMLSVDGRMEGELHDGDVVQVQRSAIKARFLRLRSRNDFYDTLVERLTPHNGEAHDRAD